MIKTILGGLATGAAFLFLFMAYTNERFNWYDNTIAEAIAWVILFSGLILILIGVIQRK
jgi:predicted phage tail protein